MSAFWSVDFAPLLCAVLSALAAALLGSFAILKRQSLMGDALSHSVLPGLAVAFIVTGVVASVPMMIGAFIACLVAVAAIEALKRFARFEPSLAMGIVFVVMFALGIILLERGVGRGVHLDASHALYGALEFVYWEGLLAGRDLLSMDTWAAMPRQIAFTGFMAAAVCLLIVVFFKEIGAACFDPVYMRSLRYPVFAMDIGLSVLIAMVAVASFEASGSILFIALLICPAGAARMVTDNLRTQIILSAGIGVFSAVAGYAAASLIPAALGLSYAFPAAACIAVCAGLVQAGCMIFAPRYGMLAKAR